MPKRDKKNLPLVTQEIQPLDEAKQPSGFWAAFRKSPFPPPAELERYESLYPGVTKQIFDSFVSQSNHRMELEKRVIEGDNKRANTAQHYSFVITLSILALAAYLFYKGNDGYAITSVFTALAPIIISFINSSITRKREREQKKREMSEILSKRLPKNNKNPK